MGGGFYHIVACMVYGTIVSVHRLEQILAVRETGVVVVRHDVVNFPESSNDALYVTRFNRI